MMWADAIDVQCGLNLVLQSRVTILLVTNIRLPVKFVKGLSLSQCKCGHDLTYNTLNFFGILYIQNLSVRTPRCIIVLKITQEFRKEFWQRGRNYIYLITHTLVRCLKVYIQQAAIVFIRKKIHIIANYQVERISKSTSDGRKFFKNK